MCWFIDLHHQGEEKLMKKTLLAVGAMLMLASPALAVINLQITEIWPGQAGDDVTGDWFEITNFGDMPWIRGVSSEIRVDDGGQVFANSAALLGIGSIQPNQSVVVLMEATYDDKQSFNDVWDPVKNQKLQKIGVVDGNGLGLGQPSDGVTIWLDGNLADFESYAGSGVLNNGQSWDVVLGAYSLPGNASGAVASLALGGDELDTPAIASPGMVAGTSYVPEPSSIVMLGLAAWGLATRRR
jgi:hypothetical protein